MQDDKFHKFTEHELNGVELPKQFTFPFNYIPHPLSKIAASHLQEYLKTQNDWCTELERGKMMGVLIVSRTSPNNPQKTETGFLAAFSGNLVHNNNHPYFVPPIYDLLSEKGFFRLEEENISAINRQINEVLHSDERKNILENLAIMEQDARNAISEYKQFMKESKVKRDELRKNGYDTSQLITESQFQKAELKRVQSRWHANIALLKNKLTTIDEYINSLKSERQQRSAILQEKIFRHFIILNARGEKRDLCDIFSKTPQGTPPAGAGECAAPKLLQYAYIKGYKPLAMAEFWIGESPKDVIRKHGCFYPSCKAKCEPILGWALQGLNVEPNPLEQTRIDNNIDIVYEDDWLIIVNKPEGVLSVPGKLSTDSIQERIESIFSKREKPFIVHRLDMATSGLLIFAKSQAIHKYMQAMFKSREIKKRYIAILDGIITPDRGTITLPLILNPLERPLQTVSHTHGKPAITHFEVLERKNGKTRVVFHPITGRTHQLRIHSAHPEGLNTPIVGDSLYGTPADRLLLHAESIEFTHPITQKTINITSHCPF